MEIVAYSSARRGAVERMNAKLAAAGSEWRFEPEERPTDADQLSVWTESFVAVEDDEVYGGYILKHQAFLLAGRPIDVADLQMPLSVGEVDSAFSRVSAALLIDVLRRSPCVYALGLGSEDTQFARLLTAAGWRHIAVPFYFSVKSPNRFARNIRLPSDKARAERLLRVLARFQLASIAFRLRKFVSSRTSSRQRRPAPAQAREVSSFDGAADDLFATHASSYSLLGDRRSAALSSLYPVDDARYLRIIVQRDGQDIGWAVLLDTQMQNDKYFGDMRVGSLVDCFSAPEDAQAVVAVSDDILTDRGVDLAISNQLHPAWCAALEAAEYQSGPSNFFFYFSEDLAAELAAIPDSENGIHLNRGDGEGPANL